jgi:5-methyltetrahydropteroyltriglutamate--homocysteine methyltransferase
METMHAHVVGSLLRPDELLEAVRRRDSGEITGQEWEVVAKRSVEQAVGVQQRSGLPVVTDGEMRRRVFYDPYVTGLQNLSSHPGATVMFRSDAGDTWSITTPFSVVEKLSPIKPSPLVAEYEFAQSVSDRPVKVTLPSPMLAIRFWGEHSRDAYPDPFELVTDAAEMVRGWGQELVAAGCQHIQIDAPELLAAFSDPAVRERYYDSQGLSSERFLELGTELVNHVGDLPGATTALHVCKGNGPDDTYIATGSYEELSTQLFTRASNFDMFLLEYDDARSGGFEPLRNLPDEKLAVLGLVSTKRAQLEEPSTIVAAIKDAAQYHPIESLALSPQCGFASAAESAADRRFDMAAQEAKLRSVVEIAETVWA